MHKLLARQLRRFFVSADAVPEPLAPFLAAVEDAYRQSDEERAMLEHSMETVSRELADRFQKLRDALEQRDEINQALSLLAATLESTADGILVVDLQGRVVRSNSKFAQLWRIPESAIAASEVGKRLDSFQDQLEDPEDFTRKVRELYADPNASSVDILRFKDGRVFERYSLPQHILGVTVGRVWSFRDITEQRNLEQQLRQSQKMEAIGQLAGGIAHDFNNLLTAILGYTELVSSEVGKESPLSDSLEEIRKAAERAASLTRQLLAFSRKQVLEPKVLDLNALLVNLDNMLRRLIGADVELAVVCGPKLGHVRADPSQIEQVILNLVINARDAMPSGGKVTIETSDVSLDESFARTHPTVQPGPHVEISVSDTGTGMDDATRAHIFEPFFTTKEKGKGTGLGLATVYGIVKQSSGSIWVDSQPGKGAAFTIYLPRVEAALPVAPPPDVTTESLDGTETILLAEDEAPVRHLARQILEARGYRVLDASDGVQALDVARAAQGPIHLVLTDVVMPGMTGTELVTRLLEARPDLRVLYMSGYSGEAIVRAGSPGSQHGFLSKPFTPEALARKVRAALS